MRLITKSIALAVLLVACTDNKTSSTVVDHPQVMAVLDSTLMQGDFSKIDQLSTSKIVESLLDVDVSASFGHDFTGPHGGIALFSSEGKTVGFLNYYTTDRYFLIILLTSTKSDKLAVSDLRVIEKNSKQRLLSLSGKSDTEKFKHLLVITSDDITNSSIRSVDYVYSSAPSFKKIIEIKEPSLKIFNEEG
jgi:hypothetical protein